MSQKVASEIKNPKGMVIDLDIAIKAIEQGKFFCAKTFVEGVYLSLMRECQRRLDEKKRLK